MNPARLAAGLLLPVLFSLTPLSAALKPGDFVTSGPTSAKRIALSFDDGPGPQTEEFLALLAKYNVKATFFMLGELAKGRPAVAKKVAEAGHEVASHTYTHTNYVKRLREEKAALGGTPDIEQKATDNVQAELVSQMKKSREWIEKAIGKKITLCRMPYGVDRKWVKEAAKESDFVLVNWTYGADWLPKSYDELAPEYEKAIRPGAILLLHDGNAKREKSLKLTEDVIKTAKEKGYEIVTVGELIGLR